MVDSHKPQAVGQRHRRLLLSSVLGLMAGALASPLGSYAQEAPSEPLPEVEPTTGGSQLPTDARFECQISDGAFTVMYLPESQPDRAYPWATPGEMGGGWTAERRCYTISERLEEYRPEGLVELQVGTENGYDTVCATTEQVPGLCKIVFTVPPGQDPVGTRDRVFDNLVLADGGSDTTVVNTFADSGNSNILGQIGDVLSFPIPGAGSQARTGIDLKPFLDPADGGTGTALTRSAPAGRPLNPDNFR